MPHQFQIHCVSRSENAKFFCLVSFLFYELKDLALPIQLRYETHWYNLFFQVKYLRKKKVPGWVFLRRWVKRLWLRRNRRYAQKQIVSWWLLWMEPNGKCCFFAFTGTSSTRASKQILIIPSLRVSVLHFYLKLIAQFHDIIDSSWIPFLIMAINSVYWLLLFPPYWNFRLLPDFLYYK